MTSSVPPSTPSVPATNYYSYGQYPQATTTPYTNPYAAATPNPYAPSTSTPYNPLNYTPNPYASSSFPFPSSLQAATTNPPPKVKKTGTGTIRPSSPAGAAITAKEASQTIQRLAAVELNDAGFSGAKTDAVYMLEMEVTNFVQSLYRLAHEYANLANRSGPVYTDLLLASEEFDREWAYEVGPNNLAKWVRKRKRKETNKGKRNHAPKLVSPPSRSPSPELLESDEDVDMEPVTTTTTVTVTPAPAMPSVPPVAHPSHLVLNPASIPQTQTTTVVKPRPIPASTLRNLPGNLPGLPPKHTYFQTPSSQNRASQVSTATSSSSSTTKTQNQIQMEKKLRTASLVQESLKNLLLATEDTGVNQEDAELLGHIVNWEGTLMAGQAGKKRWRV